MAFTDRTRERGFALLTVLGTTMILVWLAGSSGQTARGAVVLAAGQTALAQANEAADSGIWIAAVALDRAIANGADPAAATVPEQLSIGGAAVAVAWSDMSHRVEVNRADLDALTAAATIAGLPDPELIAGRLIAARDEVAGGALSWRLPPRAFHAETDLIGPLNEEEWRRLRPYVTLHRQPDPTYGTRLVEIVVAARMPDGAAADRRAIVLVGKGVRLLDWQARRLQS